MRAPHGPRTPAGWIHLGAVLGLAIVIAVALILGVLLAGHLGP